jgi:hypothetical protein
MLVAVGAKLCSRCKAEKNLDAFSTNRAMKDGKNIYCRDCLSVADKSRRRKLTSTVREPVAEKRCGRCREVKPASDYALNRCSTTGLQSSCKQCVRRLVLDRTLAGVRPPDEKECSACGKTLPASGFHRNRSVSTTLAPACKDCNRRKVRAAKYKIGEEWLNRVDETGNCEICQIEIDGPRKHLDHDHKTGLPRGVLCSRCNTMLGQAGDSVELLKTAQMYLMKFNLTQGVVSRAS